jgi:uncharacterized membrane protein
MAYIRGLDALGALHVTLGLVTVGVGSVMVMLGKGTPLHRRVGLLYASLMTLLNATALAIYDRFGGFGPFHWLAIVSVGTLAAGLVPVWRRRPHAWLDVHARFMSWSYAGLVAAFVAEIGVRVPGVSFAAGVIAPTGAVLLTAAILIHRRIPAIVARLGAVALLAAAMTAAAGAMTLTITLR